MPMSDPNLVTSGLSQRIIVGGCDVRIEIYRLETEQSWTLELVDEEGTSVVWDEQFGVDKDAADEAKEALASEGLSLFRPSGSVIPFPRT